MVNISFFFCFLVKEIEGSCLKKMEEEMRCEESNTTNTGGNGEHIKRKPNPQ